MKYLSLCLALGAALTLTACATTPSKPKTFDQLGQFSAYPLNAQTFRISFQADPNMSYGAAEEITLVKSAQTTVQKGFRFFKVLNDPSNQSQKPPRQAVVYPSAPSFYPYGYGAYEYRDEGRSAQAPYELGVQWVAESDWWIQGGMRGHFKISTDGSDARVFYGLKRI